MSPKKLIRNATLDDATELVQLWQSCDLLRPWNNPISDIERALDTWPSLFFVIESDGKIIASAMTGYDGHRGAVYYFSVHPDYQGEGIGVYLMDYIEKKLEDLGCPKINLCVRSDNETVLAFYEHMGYNVENTSLLGKRLIKDDPI